MENHTHSEESDQNQDGMKIHSISEEVTKVELNLVLPKDQRLRNLIYESLSKIIQLTAIDGDNWIQDSEGHRYSFLYPESSNLSINDISRTLSKACRFGGKTKRFYSVAEHCIIASYYPGLTPWMRMQVFAHDWHEAYLVDLPGPLKQLIPGYSYLCRICDEVLSDKFKHIELTDRETKKVIKMVDMEMLRAEASQLIRGPLMDWYAFESVSNPVTGICKELQDRILCLSPREAEKEFLNRYYELLSPLEA